jgi:hypothetical protein
MDIPVSRTDACPIAARLVASCSDHERTLVSKMNRNDDSGHILHAFVRKRRKSPHHKHVVDQEGDRVGVVKIRRTLDPASCGRHAASKKTLYDPIRVPIVALSEPTTRHCGITSCQPVRQQTDEGMRRCKE